MFPSRLPVTTYVWRAVRTDQFLEKGTAKVASNLYRVSGPLGGAAFNRAVDTPCTRLMQKNKQTKAVKYLICLATWVQVQIYVSHNTRLNSSQVDFVK